MDKENGVADETHAIHGGALPLITEEGFKGILTISGLPQVEDHLLAVEVLERSSGTGVLWCDGRRTHDLPVGARVEVTRSEKPVRLARLRIGPFTDRLVNKFSLPVAGWRGPEEPKS